MFSLELKPLDTGSDEERSTFGTFAVEVNGQCLTEGVGPDGDLRPGPYVSGYHAAEWLLWNWWRLHCEPERARRTTDLVAGTPTVADRRRLRLAERHHRLGWSTCGLHRRSVARHGISVPLSWCRRYRIGVR